MILDFDKVEAELFNSLETKAKTNIAQAAAKNVRKACRIMHESKANLSYSSVAAFIANVDNYEIFEKINGNVPPKRQSIQNNDFLKSIIDLYKAQQAGLTSLATKEIKTEKQYPSEGLDAKTKLYIDLLKQQVESFRSESNNLAKAIEDNSKSSPIGLGLSYDTTENQASASLVLCQDKAAPSLDSVILKKISKLPEEMPEHFQVKSHNGKSALFLCSPSGDKRILSSTEWMHLSKEGKK